MLENRLLAASHEKSPGWVPSEPAVPSYAGTARTLRHTSQMMTATTNDRRMRRSTPS
jgi:hypothetical protein